MCFHTPFMSSHRYMTALTDSEEEEPNEGEQGDKKQAEDELNVLLKEVDRLHEGTEFDKRESLNILLKQEAEVCILAVSLSSAEYLHQENLMVLCTLPVWTGLQVSVAVNSSLLRCS